MKGLLNYITHIRLGIIVFVYTSYIWHLTYRLKLENLPNKHHHHHHHHPNHGNLQGLSDVAQKYNNKCNKTIKM